MGRARLFRIGWLTAALAFVVACTSASGTVRGVVLDVEGTLDEVTAFTVLEEGSQIGFVTMEGGRYSFPLGHLRDHARSGDPVLVGWETVDGQRVAVEIEDG